MLQKLKIRNVRCLENVELDTGKKLVLFWGINGSGKTSVLEAINILSNGKSFRTSRIDEVITKGQKDIVVYGEIEKNGIRSTVGFEHKDRGKNSRIGGKKVSVVSVARFLPVRALGADSQSILDGNPDARRNLLDWGLFHVEQNYHEIWKKVREALDQRNKLLKLGKTGSAEFTVWNEQFATYSHELTSFRNTHVAELNQRLIDWYKTAGYSDTIEIKLFPGWDESVGLKKELNNFLRLDAASGHTKVGPHRFDFKVNLSDMCSKNHLSRGQQKILVNALTMVQGQMIEEKTGSRAILLSDEFFSELDKTNSQKLLEMISDNFEQAFLTINGEVLPSALQNYDYELFHVEQGSIFK